MHIAKRRVFYPVGDGVCVWYAGWKALALLRLGERREAEKMLDRMSLYL